VSAAWRHTALYSGDLGGSHHDAVIRIDGELRGGGSILERGLKAMGVFGSPPPRIVLGDPQSWGRQTGVLLF